MLGRDFPGKDKIAMEGLALRHYWLNKDMFFIENGVLFYKWIEDKGNKRSQRLMVPKVFRPTIIEMCYCPPYSGHQGISRTIQRVKDKFYWYGMTSEIDTWVRQCVECGSQKKSSETSRARHKQISSQNGRKSTQSLANMPNIQDIHQTDSC